jgi:glycerophosphoryl diester phosphodiesterase
VAPENTLASFRRAVQLGADALECDVHLTRDGVPVVFHDFTLERCTDFAERARGSGQRLSPFLGDWTLEELSRLDAGSWYGKTDPFGQVKAGRVGPAELDSFRGERIPTLQEVLDLCREAGVGLVLEIKQGARPSEELVRRAVDQVRAGRMLDGTALISFDHPSLLLARRMEPSLAVGALLVERLADPGRYAREVLGARLVSVYCPEGVFTRCAPEDSYLAEDARLAHEAGVAYHVWTANAPEDLHGLMRAGVDGIATDFPQRLVEALGRGSPARGLVLRAPEQL